MKKTVTIFKTMLMAAVVFVMAQGCVPTGGPTPTGTLLLNHPSELVFFPGSSWPAYTNLIGTYTVEIYKDSDNSLKTSRAITYDGSGNNNQHFSLTSDTYYIKMKNGNNYRAMIGADSENRSQRFTINNDQTTTVNLQFSRNF